MPIEENKNSIITILSIKLIANDYTRIALKKIKYVKIREMKSNKN